MARNLILLVFVLASSLSYAGRPNVVMICIDDLNDWVEPLGGHPQIKTPAMSSLAKRGVVFANAHCQSPLCNPSRTSLMLSRRPASTGVYGLRPWFRTLEDWEDAVSLPQYFKAAGYETYSGGKVYHSIRKDPPNATVREFDQLGTARRNGSTAQAKADSGNPAGKSSADGLGRL